MRSRTVASLFTGAGGLDYGFEMAGFRVAVALEMDHDCCRTIRQNRDWQLIEQDIHEVPSSLILSRSGLREGEVDLLIGGPPCQPFSKSGYWVNGDTRRLSDPRARTLDAYMRCVSDLLPQVFLLENVHGISYSGKEDGFLHLDALTREINERQGTSYQLSWKVLDASWYGVPQTRSRFFLVGHRGGRTFRFPDPSHACVFAEPAGLLDSQGLNPVATAWDAIGGLEPDGDEDLAVRGHWADLLPSIPEGENYLWHTDRRGGLPLFGWRTRYWSFLLKLAKSRPSWTIQAQPGPAIGPFHWESRRLSVREMARLQTFPDDIQLYGSRVSVQRQIGNAVPSLLAEVLARDLGRQFFSLEYSDPPSLRVPPKAPIPPPEPVQPVPERFLRLRGFHPPHPGTRRRRGEDAAGAVSDLA